MQHVQTHVSRSPAEHAGLTATDHEVARHDPDYWTISWAGQGHLPQPIDVLPEYLQIKAGRRDLAIGGLQTERQRQIDQLNQRLNDMADVLESLPAQIGAMR